MGQLERDSTSNQQGTGDYAVRGIRCPWCNSERVERIAEFGPQLMTQQYVCLDCRSPFEVIRQR